ncbi:KAP family NTPase [Vibrio lamellibrachiae]|uniref:KAP family P-loop NTPase fold protein n=1 Tax=Vibrio lamellibrachiae TaxID=2910253 RepID=UPI003D126E2D
MPDRNAMEWNESVLIGDTTFPSDELDRAKYAEFLTKFLSSQGFDEARPLEERKRNYVLNLNSTWGSGKTYFLKRWANDIKEHYPVVYIDAWEKDYSEDPLMTVVSAIIKDLSDQAGKSQDKFKAPTKLIGLLKAAAPGLASGLSKKFLGIDPVAIMEAQENSEEGADIESISVEGDNNEKIDISSAASKVVSHLINEHEAKGEAINNLKRNVSDWVSAAKAHKGTSFPAFVFVDELDRCRPSYAVEMLETIKHIFDIPGVVFVVATDTEQLQHAVKAVYGEGFDARVYLGRFFNSRFSLKAPELKSLLDVHCDAYKLSSSYLHDRKIEILPNTDNGNDTLRNVSMVLDAFQVSARTAIQIAERIIATISNMPKNSCIDVLMLTTLHCLKELDNELFEEIVSGNFQRVNRDGEKTNIIYLAEYLETYLPKTNGVVSMNLDPLKITNRLDGGTFNSTQNPYRTGVFQFDYIDYLKGVFVEHFDSSNKRASAYLLLGGGTQTRNKLSPLQTIAEKLLNHYSENSRDITNLNHGMAGVLWLQYLYIAHPYGSIDKNEYKDFVELASAFDWMGKEELPEP